MLPSRVLIIEDDLIFLDTLSSTLRLKLPDGHIDTADSVCRLWSGSGRWTTRPSSVTHTSPPRRHRLCPGCAKNSSRCPVLLLVEKHQEDLLRQAMDAGAYDVLVKPVEEGTLLFAVRRAIEVSRAAVRVKREEAQFVATVRRTMKDLEVLYGAYGLQSHFEAFMGSLDGEKADLSISG
jgi:DNA-binding NtrC family response regulator